MNNYLKNAAITVNVYNNIVNSKHKRLRHFQFNRTNITFNLSDYGFDDNVTVVLDGFTGDLRGGCDIDTNTIFIYADCTVLKDIYLYRSVKDFKAMMLNEQIKNIFLHELAHILDLGSNIKQHDYRTPNNEKFYEYDRSLCKRHSKKQSAKYYYSRSEYAARLTTALAYAIIYFDNRKDFDTKDIISVCSDYIIDNYDGYKVHKKIKLKYSKYVQSLCEFLLNGDERTLIQKILC